MQIHEVQKQTGLTRKAIEYDTERGLVKPAVLDNGYRDYSQQDVGRLQKISVYRKLGLSTGEIKLVLTDETNETLQSVCVKKELQLRWEAAKKDMLLRLSRGASIGEISLELHSIEQSKTVAEKLLESFPGYYGRMVCLHFARFLNMPIKTLEQQAAFALILSFLDNLPSLELPKDLEEYLRECTLYLDVQRMQDVLEVTKHSIENPEEFLSRYGEQTAQYLKFRQSEEYQNSPAGRLLKWMQHLNESNGYNDVFLPAMRRLSPAYQEYVQQLQIANEKLLAAFE